MTSRLEQGIPTPAIVRDETGEKLYWSSHDFGQPNDKNAVRTFDQSVHVNYLPVFDRIEIEEDPAQKRVGERPSFREVVNSLSPERRDNLLQKMEIFETRAKKDNLKPEQVEDTYNHARRLIENDSVGLTEEQRLNLFEQIISNAADPTSIDQGFHETCGAAAVEVRSYIRHPEKSAAFVVEAALSGRVFTPNGVALSIDLTPHDTSKLPVSMSGQRSHASEIFQVAAINLVLNERENVRPGSIVYHQQDRRSDSKDTGERVTDYSGAVSSSNKFQGLYVDDVLKMNKLITGEDEKDIVLWKSQAKRSNQIGKVFTSESDLEKEIVQAKKGGNLPLILYVYSGSEPLWQDAPSNANGGKGGWHFINVTDIKEGPPTLVSIDSTWSKRGDYSEKTRNSIKLGDLYLATVSPKEAEEQLRKQVVADNARGKVDTGRQVALARQEWINSKLSDAELEQSLRELLLFSEARWSSETKNGKLDAQEHQRSINKVMEAVDRLPYANKLNMLEVLRNRKIIDEAEFKSAVVSTAIELTDQKMLQGNGERLNKEAQMALWAAQATLEKILKGMSEEVREQAKAQIQNGQNPDERGFFATRWRERRGRRKP